MESVKQKQRNNSVDIIRGIAMLMVVLGHTMTGSSTGSQSSLIFNFIWALQMPLFMIISGYVVKYSKEICSLNDLFKFIKRRTISYLFPWVVWTFLIRGFAFNETVYFDIKYLLFNMDSGYWFLFSIWTISIVFAFSRFIANKLSKKEKILISAFITLFVFGMGAVLLGLIGLKFGLSFLCIKLTLYYMPFYILGYLWGMAKDKFCSLKYGSAIVDFVILLAGVIFISIISRVNLYEISDGIYGIIIRAIASVSGCAALCGMLVKLETESRIMKIFEYAGIHSLEIYLIHGIVLSMLNPSVVSKFSILSGFINVGINFVLTAALSMLMAYLLNKNNICRFISRCFRTMD